jgi:DNA-binding beta-propeller fold protein YncE
VTNPEHWVFEGTGVKNRDALNNVVGPEWDGVADNGASPAGLEVLTSAITLNNAGVFTAGEANTTVYYPTKNSFVFAGGTIDWGLGLADGLFADARIERMTENVLARAGLVSQLPPTEPQPRPTLPPIADSKLLAGSGDAAQSDDTAAKAGFAGPSGIAAGPDGKLYIIDRGERAVRVLSRDGMVSTLIRGGFSRPNSIVIDAHGTLFVSDAGSNQIIEIASDGTYAPYAGTGDEGADDASDRLLAKFSAPRGLALGPDGALYVADNQNDAIRRIDASGVKTVATGLRLVNAVAVAADGAVYYSTIADGQIGVVRDGKVTVIANVSGDAGNREGPAEQARLEPGEGLIVEDARLVFADAQNNRVRALSLSGAHTISTLFGDGNAAADASDTMHTYMPRAIVPYDGGYALADFGQRRILWFKEAR